MLFTVFQTSASRTNAKQKQFELLSAGQIFWPRERFFYLSSDINWFLFQFDAKKSPKNVKQANIVSDMNSNDTLTFGAV